jgi:muconate cycloisomerase
MAPDRPGARSALEMALIDVVGRLRGLTAAALLGGTNREMVRVLAIVPADTPENALAALHEAKARGITAFKLKVGSSRVDDDIEILRQVRRYAGDDCFLAADANMAWDVDTACRYEQAARDLALDYLEQPVADDLETLTQLAQRCKVPISADESVHDAGSIAPLARTGVAGISLKACKLGSLASLVASSSAASAIGLRVGHAMMMESGLSTAASLHASCASRKLEWHLNIGVDFLAIDPASANLRWTAGSISLPEASGLGVEIDMKAILPFKK